MVLRDASAASEAVKVAEVNSFCASEDFPQLDLGTVEVVTLLFRKILAGAIYIKCEHRHRRLERGALAPLTLFCGPFQRLRNCRRTAACEYVIFKVERVAGLCHASRPTMG